MTPPTTAAPAAPAATLGPRPAFPEPNPHPMPIPRDPAWFTWDDPEGRPAAFNAFGA